MTSRTRFAVFALALLAAVAPPRHPAAGAERAPENSSAGAGAGARTEVGAGAQAPSLALTDSAGPRIRLANALKTERSLTLSEAIELALKKNEGILIQRESLTAANAAVSGAKGAYDPLLEVGGGWRQANQPVNSAFSGAPEGEAAPTTKTSDGGAAIRQLLPTGAEVTLSASAAREETDGAFELLSPAYSTQAGVALRQPLLKGLTIDNARFTIRAAKADRTLSTAELTREITETVAAVEKAYWRLIAARRAVLVQEEAVRLAEEQLSETRARVEKGAAPETEVAEPRAEVERRRGDLLSLMEATARAGNSLKLLILSDDDTELWATRLAPDSSEARANVDIVPIDANEAMTQALKFRPELTAAEAVVERRKAETAFARNGVYPTLDAVVSYDRYGLTGSENPNAAAPGAVPPGLDGNLGDSFSMLGSGDFDDVRVGVEFSFPIFNRSARADSKIARSIERQAQSQLAGTRKGIRAEVLNAIAALETAGQRIEAARAGLDAAEIQLSAEKDRYAAGLSTNFLVLTRQNDLSRARLDEISAITDYRTARTEMARATGSLLESHGIDTVE
jgi:outer membrane protein TolC